MGSADKRFGYLAQEVRVAEPDAVEERRLVDALVAARHRGFGLRGGARDAVASRPALDRRDLPALREQPPEVAPLVLVAELGEQFRFACALRRALELAAQGLQVERRQVLAGDVIVDIGRETTTTPSSSCKNRDLPFIPSSFIQRRTSASWTKIRSVGIEASPWRRKIRLCECR